MRKDSLIILVTSTVLTLGIVGGAHYLYLQGQRKAPNEAAVKPQSGIVTAKVKNRTVQPANRRTATPIKCTKSDGSVFWTNASRCEDADLNNRLSYADPVKPVTRVKYTQVEKNTTESRSSRGSSANEKAIKPIPSDMTVACSFPIGMAQKIETRSLSLKNDPADSIWKDSYCRWVCEAEGKGCKDVEDYLQNSGLCDRHRYRRHPDCDDIY